MNKELQYVVFLTVFFTVYLALHFFVFSKMYNLFSLKKDLSYYLIVVGLALSFPVFALIERFHHNPLTRGLYIMSTTWIGVLVFLFFSILVYLLLNWIFKFNPVVSGTVIIFVVLFLAISAIFNAYPIRYNHVVIPMEKLEKNMTIVQISDVHLGAIHNVHFLKRVVNKTNSINPDVVLITGDLFDGGGALDGEISAQLNGIKADAFFVNGNHERYAGYDNALRILNKTRIRVLKNEAVEYKGLQIVGVEDTYDDFTRPNDFISKIQFNRSQPVIMMYHQPTGLKEASEAGVDLQLSGHTHNGQLFPFDLVVKLISKYNKGLFHYNGTTLYVSQGTGTWGPPMRIGSHNELTVIHLVPQGS